MFCTSCGTVSIHVAGRTQTAGATSFALPAGVQSAPSHILGDPHRDEALEIIRAAKETPPDLDFEQRLGELFSRYSLPDDVANDLFNQALQYGPSLPLDDFERETLKPLAETWALRPQVDTAEDLDEAFTAGE